jgi:hypothetical protein
MLEIFSSEKRKDKKEKEKLALKAAAEEERVFLELLSLSEAWFFSMPVPERTALLRSIPALPRVIVSCSRRKRTSTIYGVLSALLGGSAAGLLAGGYWGIPGVLFLGMSWFLFRSVEKKTGASLVFIDPLSSAIVAELYSRSVKDGDMSSPNTSPLGDANGTPPAPPSGTENDGGTEEALSPE